MKLSDVEAQTDSLLPRAQMTFEKAYPTVRSLRVEIEDSDGMRGSRKTAPSIYTEKHFVPIINCHNPRCYGGGLDVGRLLRWQVVEPKCTHYEDTVSCCGYEGSPKGRRRDGPCDTVFRVKIDVEYQDKTSPRGPSAS